MKKVLWSVFGFAAVTGLFNGIAAVTHMSADPDQILLNVANTIAGMTHNPQLQSQIALYSLLFGFVFAVLAIRLIVYSYRERGYIGPSTMALGYFGIFLLLLGNGKGLSYLGILLFAIGLIICYGIEGEAPKDFMSKWVN